MKASAPARRSANVLRVGIGVGDVQNDGSLVEVGVDECEAALRVLNVAGKGREMAVGVAAGGFDLDYVCAQITEPAGRRREAGNIAVFDDP